MPLQWQNQDFMFTGGVDERYGDNNAPPNVLVRLDNARWYRDGLVLPRYGYTFMDNHYWSHASSAESHMLRVTSLGDFMGVPVAVDRLGHVFAYDSTATKWRECYTTSTYSVYPRHAVADRAVGLWSSCVKHGGYLAVGWNELEATSAAVYNNVRIMCPDTFGVYLDMSLGASGNNNWEQTPPLVIGHGGRITVMYITSAPAYEIRQIQTSTIQGGGTWGAAVNVGTPPAVNYRFNIAPAGTGFVTAVCSFAGGNYTISVGCYTENATSIGSVIASVIGPIVKRVLCVRTVSATFGLVLWLEVNGATYTVKAREFNPSTAAALGAEFTVASVAGGTVVVKGSVVASSLGYEIYVQTRPAPPASGVTTDTVSMYWVTLGGGASTGYDTVCNVAIGFSGAPLDDGTGSIGCVGLLSSSSTGTENTFVLADLERRAMGVLPAYQVVPRACVSPRYAYPDTYSINPAYNEGWIDSDGDIWFPVSSLTTGLTTQMFLAGFQHGSITVCRAKRDPDKNGKFLKSDFGLVSVGGVPGVFDGNMVSEFGFFEKPNIVTLSMGAPGGTVTAGVHGYCVVYVWTDKQGRQYRSVPSEHSSATLSYTEIDLGAALRDVAVTFRLPTITGRIPEASGLDFARVEIYRTLASVGAGSSLGLPMYLVCVMDALQIRGYGSSAATSTYTDTMPDATAAAQRTLYTYGSPPILSSQCVPSCHIGCFHKGRLILAGGLGWSQLWVSKYISEGYAPEFNDQLAITCQAVGKITGLASLGESLLVFSEHSTWVIYGDPPNDLGQGGSLTDPVLLEPNIGCADSRSIIVHGGVCYWWSGSGFYAMGAGGGAVLISEPVDSTVSTLYSVKSAVYCDSDNTIRWNCLVQAPLFWYGHTLVFDTVAKRWGIWRYSSSYGATLRPGAAATIGGTYYFASDSMTGAQPGIAKEGGSTDDGQAIIMTLETGWFRFAEQGHQRVRKISLWGYRHTSPGDVSATLTTERTAATQTVSWTAAELASIHALGEMRLPIKPQYGKCRAMKLSMVNSGGPSLGWYGVTFEIGNKGGITRTKDSHRG